MKAGSVIRLRKPHPCGGYEWRVLREGADLRIKCLRCGRELWLSRSKLKRLMVGDGLQSEDNSCG